MSGIFLTSDPTAPLAAVLFSIVGGIPGARSSLFGSSKKPRGYYSLCSLAFLDRSECGLETEYRRPQVPSPNLQLPDAMGELISDPRINSMRISHLKNCVVSVGIARYLSL